MNNLEKMEEMLKDNPELGQKTFEEADRLVESKEAENPKEALAKAVKTVLDLDLTEEEQDALVADNGKMDLENLDAVAGGNIFFDRVDMKDVIDLNPIGAIKKWISTYEARWNNKYAIYKAAIKNGIEEEGIDPW